MFEPVSTVALLAKAASGAFFALSGYHKLFDRERHAQLVHTLEELHVPFVRFNQWWVPGWEFIGGLGLLLTSGLAAKFFAMVLLVILCIALCTDGRKRVRSYQPIDFGDYVDDWLYLPETLHAVLLIIVLMLA